MVLNLLYIILHDGLYNYFSGLAWQVGGIVYFFLFMGKIIITFYNKFFGMGELF
jgi:hypothetical protein